MSPVPPPTAFVPASEDWDDSFDISPTAQNFALPSSSSSSSSRRSLNVSSPLRHSLPRTPVDEDDDFDLPDSFAFVPPRVGSITRLGSKTITRTTVKESWEEDFDNDFAELSLSPRRHVPDAFELEDDATLKAGATIKAMLPPRRIPKDKDEDLDFAIPDSLTHLSLAALPSSPKIKPRPRDSVSWDSPSTSGSGKKSLWDSPVRKSDTSVTSVDDGFKEEEDMEEGLIIPTATFFSNSRVNELNSMLDKKRKPYVGPKDESFEDGLVLENPKLELSNHRLKSRKAKTLKKVSKEKEREQGWARPKLGSTGLRSHSTTTTRDVRESPSLRSRSSQVKSQAMPPPASTSTSQTPRLSHQKSLYHIQPPQSPMSRKQSLASLQDAVEPRSMITPEPVATISRLTMPTSSSRAKARPPVHTIFPQFTPSSSTSSISSGPSFIPHGRKLMEMPKRRMYGDGTELEGIEDLVEKRSHRSETKSEPKSEPKVDEKRKRSTRRSKPALLIKHLGGVDKKKVVGEMTWNPQTLRWEGNEACLKDFDGPTARPALIAHYTGSSSGFVSPPIHSGLAATIRIVGDMQFDPEKMCWVSILDPEPDPFEGMADDEEEGGNTITRATARKFVSVGGNPTGSVVTSSAWSSRLASDSVSTMSASIGSWGSRVSSDVGPELWAECREAEERHKKEVRGWLIRGEAKEKKEKRLWEIRHLAMRS